MPGDHGSSSRAAGWLLALAIALVGPSGVYNPQPAWAQKSSRAQSPRPANIDRNGILMLVRGTLLALDQANKTGNYTVLRDLGAPGFQRNSAAQLSEIFANHRKDDLNLAGVAVLEPQLTLMPQIESNGMLHLAGFFPSVPVQVNFELLFAPVNRQWKLFGISVVVGEGGPLAPEAPPEPEAEVSTEVPDPPIPMVRPLRPGEKVP